MLAEEPFPAGEGCGADEIDEDADHESEGCHDEHVLEVAPGKVLVHDEEHLGEGCESEGVGNRSVGASAFFEKEEDCDDEEGDEDRELVGGEPELV